MKEETAQQTILLVEDEALLAMQEARALEKYGYQVITVHTGEQAIETMENTPAIDVILMDIFLGDGLDGTDTAEIILQKHDIPILFLTSHTEPEIVQKTEEIASYGFVVKPADITILDASIIMAVKLFRAHQELKQKEQQLWENEEKYRRLFENMSDEVHLWKVIRDENDTIQNWLLVDVNPAGLRTWKKTRAETIGKTTDNIWPEDNPVGLFMPIVKKIFAEGRPYSWESYFPGTHQLLKMTSVAFGEYFYSTGMDVTEYRRVEDALREGEEKYRFLYDTMAQGVVLQDTEGKIIEANAAAGQILGLTMDQLMGKTAYDPRWKLIKVDGTPYDPADMPSNIALRTGQPALDVCCGIYVPEEDDTYRWILISSMPRFKENDSKPYMTMTVFVDITERKQAEDELIKHQLLLKKAEEISNQGAWEWDIIKDRWMFSDNWLKIHGCQTSALTLEGLLAIAYPEDVPSIEKSFQDALKGMKPYGLEHRIIRQNDHEVRWITASGETICDASGNPVTMYGSAQDITERREAEEELKTALKEKQSLLQEILHRTKNNMAAIIGLLQLRSDGIDDAQVLQLFTDIENRIQSMLLVQQKLYQSNDFTRLDLAEYLEELASTIFHNLNFGTSKTSLTFDLTPVTVSPDTAITCGLLVNELITNASKYAFPNERTGTVRIGMHADDRGDIELCVCDNGVGLPENFDIRTVDTLGSQLVVSFVSQLQGTFDINQEQGTAWLIRFRPQEERFTHAT